MSNYEKGTSNAVYGLGFIGAVVYFVIHTTNITIWTVFLGIVKAFFWPAFLVFYAFKTFGL